MAPRAASLGKKDRALIFRTLAYAEASLSTLIRRSGESYAAHGKEVGETLQEVTDDPSLFAAAVLHDLPLHPRGRKLLAASPLSTAERKLVRKMHELRRLHIDVRAADLDKAINTFMRDPRVLWLRMAHRLNDVRHLDRFEPQLRRMIASETIHMYAAIAGRLGMMNWRREMEDRCFPILQPRLAQKLRDAFDAHREMDDACLRHTSAFLKRVLRRHGIRARCEHRIKGLYSTYRKMVIKQRTFDELTDRIAIRLIVPTVQDCYRALGIVHANFHAIPGKLKDYIGMPKENGYRSIHTVIYPLPGITEQPIEIQIRTPEMDQLSETGAASHGDYKHRTYALATGTSRVELWRNLQHLRDRSRSAREFEEALRTYFRDDHLAVFDAKNRLYHLQKPATALDFVCLVFDTRCGTLQAVRINGRERPFDTPVQNGDTVEPIFGKQMTATKQWLQCCRHSSARSLLRGLLAGKKD